MFYPVHCIGSLNSVLNGSVSVSSEPVVSFDDIDTVERAIGMPYIDC